MTVAGFFLSLVPFIIVNEKLNAVDAIKRSFALTKLNWQWVLAYSLVGIVGSLFAIIPTLGAFLSLVFSIVYLCLPAIIYTQHISPEK
jgi:uncharacterized membrane protein